METELKMLKKKSKKKYNDIFNNHLKSIYNSSLSSNIIKCEELLKKISIDYNINLNELTERYIPKNLKSKTKKKNTFLIELDECSDEENDIKKILSKKQNECKDVLEKIVIKNKICYIENREGGNIYNKELEKLGEINNGKYIFY